MTFDPLALVYIRVRSFIVKNKSVAREEEAVRMMAARVINLHSKGCEMRLSGNQTYVPCAAEYSKILPWRFPDFITIRLPECAVMIPASGVSIIIGSSLGWKGAPN
jgi:hypothetical protein